MNGHAPLAALAWPTPYRANTRLIVDDRLRCRADLRSLRVIANQHQVSARLTETVLYTDRSSPSLLAATGDVRESGGCEEASLAVYSSAHPVGLMLVMMMDGDYGACRLTAPRSRDWVGVI